MAASGVVLGGQIGQPSRLGTVSDQKSLKKKKKRRGGVAFIFLGRDSKAWGAAGRETKFEGKFPKQKGAAVGGGKKKRHRTKFGPYPHS